MKRIFADGEAGGLVKQLRQHLRDAERHRLENRTLAAKKADNDALNIVESLLRRLAGRFNHYAYSGLSRASYDTQQEAISEMFRLVWQGLTDLSGKPSALAYETHFNSIVRNRILDALRTAKRSEERIDGQRPLSLDLAVEGHEGEYADALADTHEDKQALQSLEKVLNQEVLKLFLCRIPSEKHKKVLTSRTAGDNWDVVASKAGVSEKTARKYFDEMRELLKQLLLGEK